MTMTMTPLDLNIQIFIKKDCGKTITLDIHPHDTIDHIKSKIKQKENMPPAGYFKLKYNCKYLDDERTAGHYGVVKESTLWMVWPLPGDDRGKVDGMGAVSGVA